MWSNPCSTCEIWNVSEWKKPNFSQKLNHRYQHVHAFGERSLSTVTSWSLRTPKMYTSNKPIQKTSKRSILQTRLWRQSQCALIIVAAIQANVYLYVHFSLCPFWRLRLCELICVFLQECFFFILLQKTCLHNYPCNSQCLLYWFTIPSGLHENIIQKPGMLQRWSPKLITSAFHLWATFINCQ